MRAELRLADEGLTWRELEGKIVVLAPDGRELLINRTGAVLWPLLLEGSEPERLRDRLVEDFGITSVGAEQDVEAFIGSLRERGLLELTRGEPRA